MKILANKPDDPSPIPESHMMEEENRFLRAGLWLPHVKSMCMHVHVSMCTQTHTNVIKINKQGGDQLRKTPDSHPSSTWMYTHIQTTPMHIPI